VPWADRAELSHLATPDELHHTLESAGFAVSVWNDLTAPSIDFMQAFVSASPAPLGLHAFVPNFAAKANGLIANLQEDRARLIQAVAVAR
jgi:sarcosine/dimethylglycine N-methyltransferase